MPRATLPQRRLCQRVNLSYNSIELTVTAGYGPNGEVAEVFVNAHRKVGTEVMAVARDAAILTSLLLQYGCPIEAISGAMTRDTFGAPAGISGAVVEALIERLCP